jgi:nicotinamide-nucleotide amidase
MFERAILPDLLARLAGEGETGVIASRVLRTWGTSESALAEALDGRLKDLEGTTSTIAFLASGIEGLKVRLTVRAPTGEAAQSALEEEEARIRAILAERVGDIVFGTDDETMERAVARRLLDRSLTLAVAESITGGLVASRLVNVEGASRWFRGGVVSYAADVKRLLLGVPEGPVVTSVAAESMAEGVRATLHSDVGLALSGVAGPDPDEGVEVGTVFVGLVIGDGAPRSVRLRLPGDRQRIRDYATISALDVLRRALDGLDG